MIFENKLTEADLLLNELHELEPSNDEIYIQKANIFSKQDNEMAINTLETALEFTAEEAEIIRSWRWNTFLEDYENAKLNFMRCLELENDDYAALYNIIYCFTFRATQRSDRLPKFTLDKHPYLKSLGTKLVNSISI